MATVIKGNAESTFGAGVDVTGVVVTDAPAFSATLSADFSVSSNTITKIQFDTEDFDTNSNYDNSTNYRFTPTVEGYYLFSLRAYSNSPDRLLLGVYKNGSISSWVSDTNNSADGVTRAGGSVLIYANGSTDYFEAYGLLVHPSNLKIRQDTGTFFQAYLARAT